MRLSCACAYGAVVAGLCVGFGAPAMAVTKETKTVNGFKTDYYSWKDSAGFVRTVALKRQGGGGQGNGGYAIQMSFKSAAGRYTANAPKGDGFGYFVSHERYRAFADGASQTIAKKIFGKDDSPLGRGFPVRTKYGADEKSFKSVTFSLTYPRYGTKAKGGIDLDSGEDKPLLGKAESLFKLYDLPVRITWTFQDGRSYPRVRTAVDLSKLPGPDRASFDLRGPYGKLDFNVGGSPIEYVTWGDRYRFQNTAAPLRRNATWIWNSLNDGARYNAIISNGLEFGLLEPKLYSRSSINDGYALGRGKTYQTHDVANAGCENQELPCDYEWPYQSSQYELPYDNPAGTTTSEKIAWGSTPFYGMSVPSTWDGTAGTPFDGFPKSRKIVYDTCIVYGEHVVGGLARFVSEGGGAYDCAKAD